MTVTPGATNSGNDFVDERVPGAITGTVLEDLDHNGTGDTPIAGVTVVLKDASGNPIASTTTDANGNYCFANVPAGNCTVEQTNAPGYTDVKRHRRRQPQQHRPLGQPQPGQKAPATTSSCRRASRHPGRPRGPTP
ncbi:MAG: carboxypeptidase regulatory-like domain-containing protein [Zoogloea sp.]|nr:carboxypeptidase regulatory-like domain-containing protein [Zoogloea sp.]